MRTNFCLSDKTLWAHTCTERLILRENQKSLDMRIGSICRLPSSGVRHACLCGSCAASLFSTLATCGTAASSSTETLKTSFYYYHHIIIIIMIITHVPSNVLTRFCHWINSRNVSEILNKQSVGLKQPSAVVPVWLRTTDQNIYRFVYLFPIN